MALKKGYTVRYLPVDAPMHGHYPRQEDGPFASRAAAEEAAIARIKTGAREVTIVFGAEVEIK